MHTHTIYIYTYIHTIFCEPRYYIYPVFRQSFVSSLPNPNSPEGEAPGVAPRLPASRSAPGRPWHCTCPPPCRVAPVAPVAELRPSHSIRPCLGQKKTKASSRSKSCRKKPTIWRMCKAPHSAGQLLGHFCLNSLEKTRYGASKKMVKF